MRNSGSIGDAVLRSVTGIGDFSKAEWGTLACTTKTGPGRSYNPFVSHDFLLSLEESGCAVAESGWLGQHLRLESGDGRLLGAVPCYLKSHSQGEYVFDHGWADAFERAGGRYYPKLQASIPFTPATGPRLLTVVDEREAAIKAALANGLRELCDRRSASSAHVTFADRLEAEVLENAGFLRRTDQQFHFHNDGYRSYEEFLETLASRKRKALRRERSEALQNGISIEWLTGSDLTETVWDTFYGFYTDTGSRKWGRPYLNRVFFSLVSERMADDILLVMAKRDGRYIAGALNFIGSDTLFGRHWGCLEHHRFLHFEVCYHQAIDHAIANKLDTVEAGAQGEHKLARGYQPVTTHSAHYIAHPDFRRAVADYLKHERQDVAQINTILSRHTPFRKGD